MLVVTISYITLLYLKFRVSSPLKDYSSLRPLWVITTAHILFNFGTKTLINNEGFYKLQLV